MPNGSLQGTYLRDQIEWFAKHAEFDDKRQASVCKITKVPIRFQVVHRCRADTAGPDELFVEDHKWAGSGTMNGTQESFTTMWCETCDGTFPHPHTAVRRSELIRVGG